MDLICSEKYSYIRDLEPKSRIFVAGFLGVDQSNLTSECRLLKFTPRTNLQIQQIFSLWLLRQALITFDMDRREIKQILFEVGVNLLYQKLELQGITFELFCQQLEKYCLTGEGLHLVKERPRNFLKSAQPGTQTITRETAAKILAVSPGTITRYQHFDPIFERYRGLRLDKNSWLHLYCGATNFKIYCALERRQHRKPRFAAFLELVTSQSPEYFKIAQLGDRMGFTNEYGETLFTDAINGKIATLKVDISSLLH